MALWMGAAPSARGIEADLRLGGRLALDPEIARRWPWCGSWGYPVGSPLDFSAADPDGAPGFRINRGIGGPDRRRRHHGADLANGRGGDAVRAAAHGLVIHAARDGWNGGFGHHVVLAHRMPDGGVVFTVYAHLLQGSVGVEAGEIVDAGEPLGRVGDTGRASTRHLHFEVRVPRDPGASWVRAEVVDPMAFVEARRPTARTTTGPLDDYARWAEAAAVAPRGAEASERLVRGAWWAMLARAAVSDLDRVPVDPGTLRASLLAEGLLDAADPAEADSVVTWNEVARQVSRMAERGTRLPCGPVERPVHRALCEAELGLAEPFRRIGALAAARSEPTLGRACLVLADFAPPCPGS